MMAEACWDAPSQRIKEKPIPWKEGQAKKGDIKDQRR
jgi:hypothetical protein